MKVDRCRCKDWRLFGWVGRRRQGCGEETKEGVYGLLGGGSGGDHASNSSYSLSGAKRQDDEEMQVRRMKKEK